MGSVRFLRLDRKGKSPALNGAEGKLCPSYPAPVSARVILYWAAPVCLLCWNSLFPENPGLRNIQIHHTNLLLSGTGKVLHPAVFSVFPHCSTDRRLKALVAQQQGGNRSPSLRLAGTVSPLSHQSLQSTSSRRFLGSNTSNDQGKNNKNQSQELAFGGKKPDWLQKKKPCSIKCYFYISQPSHPTDTSGKQPVLSLQNQILLMLTHSALSHLKNSKFFFNPSKHFCNA